jgi:hypothetical protein
VGTTAKEALTSTTLTVGLWLWDSNPSGQDLYGAVEGGDIGVGHQAPDVAIGFYRKVRLPRDRNVSFVGASLDCTLQ